MAKPFTLLSVELMAKPFTLLSVVTSASTGQQYEIRRGADGVVYCSCKGWTFSKTTPKSCKHLRAYQADLATKPSPMFQGVAVSVPLPQKPALPPCWIEAGLVLDAVMAVASADFGKPSRLYLPPDSLKRMRTVLAERLASFIPPVPAAAAFAEPGVRMITFDD